MGGEQSSSTAQPSEMSPGAPSLMLGPIHAFGSGCFFVFGVIYLAFVHSAYMFLSNFLFGTLCILSWYGLRRADDALRSSVFLCVVYTGLVNVAVHLGQTPLPMVFWGMSVAIAATFMFRIRGVLTWMAVSLAFHPIVAGLKVGPLAERVIPLDAFQTQLLTGASYAGLLLFLTYSFVLFRRRLDRALGRLSAQTAALRAGESLLAESQRVGRIGSFEIDLRRDRWTGSAVLHEILGLEGSAPLPLDVLRSVVHPDDLPSLQQYFREQVLVRREPYDREMRLVCRDGDPERWVHARAEVYADEAGVPARLIGTMQDVTRLKHEEAERRAMELRLFQAQKLESLGVMAGGIAHDFNNLLTGMLANINLAQSQLRGGRGEREAALQKAETAALRAAELTRQMLAFSGKRQFVVQELDLHQTILEMAELVNASIPKHVTLRFVLGRPAPRVRGDGSQIRQVVMNLLLNGAEAIGEGPGEVTVRTIPHELPQGIVEGGLAGHELAPGRYAKIEVVDTGCGMDDETQARMFDPFFTTKFTGRGLGLAAVLGIVRSHGGAISVTSAPGQGTRIQILLPLLEGEAVRDESTPRTSAVETRAVDEDHEREVSLAPVSAERGRAWCGRVLVIDDEATVRDVVRMVLEEANIAVEEADDGDTGLTRADELGPRLDAVLLDLTMPRLGGVPTFAELRRRHPALPVVLMSGYGCLEPAKLFGGPGPEGLLEKPFGSRALLAAVNAVLARQPQAVSTRS